jgi:hypothetical protein
MASSCVWGIERVVGEIHEVRLGWWGDDVGLS